MLHGNFTQNRSWLWHFSCFVCRLIYSWWDSTKASAQAQDKTTQYGLYGTQTAVSTHTRELKPQLPFLTSDSNRQKQIKWGWDSTVHVWSRFCWNTKMHIWTFFFSRNCSRKRGWGFNTILLSNLKHEQPLHVVSARCTLKSMVLHSSICLIVIKE